MDKYFKEVGAKVVLLTERQREDQKLTKEEASMHRIAKLELPLQFPKERKIPMKKR